MRVSQVTRVADSGLLARRPKQSPWRRLALWLALLVVGAYAFCLGALSLLRFVNPVRTMVQIERAIEARANGEPERFARQFTPLEAIPVALQHAVVAAEDGGFYRHRGIDWAEMRSAWRERHERGRLRGASTITQQLVKNLFLTTDRSYLRKGVELLLTPAADAILGKPRILELYLNEVEWGPGVWGAAAAAQWHYAKPLEAITRDEAARLAACLPAPRSRRPQEMGDYAAVIEQRMRQRGW